MADEKKMNLRLFLFCKPACNAAQNCSSHEEQRSYSNGHDRAWRQAFKIVAATSKQGSNIRILDALEGMKAMMAGSTDPLDIYIIDENPAKLVMLAGLYHSRPAEERTTVGLYELNPNADGEIEFMPVEPPPADAEAS